MKFAILFIVSLTIANSAFARTVNLNIDANINDAHVVKVTGVAYDDASQFVRKVPSNEVKVALSKLCAQTNQVPKITLCNSHDDFNSNYSCMAICQ